MFRKLLLLVAIADPERSGVALNQPQRRTRRILIVFGKKLRYGSELWYTGYGDGRVLGVFAELRIGE